jgi:hypothetical protein
VEGLVARKFVRSSTTDQVSPRLPGLDVVDLRARGRYHFLAAIFCS